MSTPQAPDTAPASPSDRRSASAISPSAGPVATHQLTHITSWTYVFGLATVAALVVVLVSGSTLALKGPAWWHLTGVGHLFNSIHLWAAELLFFFMLLHMGAKYWTAAWRGGRTGVWISGAVALLVAVPTALTGYLSQQNFDAQWISTQAKDAFNAIGAGAFFNVMDFGQMYSYHVLLLPLATVALVVAHLLLVHRHGLVPPLGLDARRHARGGR